MCGIAGLIEVAPFKGRSEPVQILQAMARSLAHRGPDSDGIWFDPEVRVGLSHRRLAVVDLSPSGKQPMVSACGRYVIVFNGEIYNYRDIRTELEGCGKGTWRSASDTEVLLEAVAAWGFEAALKKAVGMFAVVMWDRDTRRLLLARDRSGEKPLYYGWVGNCFAFASEIKALREIPGFSGKIDRCALAFYMRYSYVPTPYSIYKGICKLPPGHGLAMSLEEVQNRRVPSPQMYWSLSAVVQAGMARPLSFETESGAIEYLESCLRQAVRAQMVADVPLGAFLSGGVDSSTVVALMQAEARRRGAPPVKTFSIGFHESTYDEAQYAKAVAAHLGTDHTELYVSPEEAMAVIPRLPAIWDEPFSDPSQIPTYLLSRLARRHVTVSLSGDGGDELFCGYNRYVLGYRVWRTLRVLPATVRMALGFLLAHVPDQRLDRLLERLPGKMRLLQLGDRLPKLVEVLQCRNGEDFYQGLVSHWKRPEDVVIGAVKPKTLFGQTECMEGLAGFRERMMYLDAMIYLPDDILTKVDRASMAVGLESRVPLLDHRVIECAWRLPMSLKYRHGQGKWILRQVLYRHVPKGIIDRPKMGFGIPLGRWLRGPLREWSESLLSEHRLREEGFFASSPIRRMWQAHLAGERGYHFCLWNVLMFQAWLERQKM